jgi:hypothetical protein
MQRGLLLLLVFASLVLAATQEFRIETRPIAGGSELITVFGPLASGGGEIPMLSVLRDTLGDSDPQAARLRYVWILTSTRPSILQRAAASIPFLYWRPDLGKHADHVPAPVIDLGAVYRPVWGSVAGSAAQLAAFDPNGAILRTSSLSYRNNVEDHRRTQLIEGLAVLSELEDQPDVKAILSDPDLLEIETRLTLACQMLGGLVSSKNLENAYLKQRARYEETRAHNWELLRQRAEMNGLYFEPLGLNGKATHALLWVDAAEVGADRKFDGHFLSISNPYRDARLTAWNGYRQVRDGREMIPLALYALDYPKVPLLLVDFRDAGAPKRREMLRHATTDTITGVLGISKFGNWPYMTGSWAFEFVRTRHGAAMNRTARLRAFAEVRQWLAIDESIESGLRQDLQKRLERIGVNPIGESVFDEAEIARRQYAALLKYAGDPQGLPARIAHDRAAESTAYHHSLTARVGMDVAHVASLGIYSHHEQTDSIAEDRRVAKQIEFLSKVAQSGPQAEIVWNMEEVRRAVDQLAASRLPKRSAELVAKIMRQTNDEETRALCERALQSLDAVIAAGGGMQ